MNDDNMKMTELEFTKATLFSSDADFAAESAAMAKRSHKRRQRDPDIRALARFARWLDTADQNHRRAAIRWLADKYLGIRR